MRRALRRGVFRWPGLFCSIGVLLLVVAALRYEASVVDPLAVDIDCDWIRESRRKLRKCLDKRDAMRLSVAREALHSIDQYPTPLERDVVRLRLASSSPRMAEIICRELETDQGIQLSKRLIGRPHLYADNASWGKRQEVDVSSIAKEAGGGRRKDAGSEDE